MMTLTKEERKKRIRDLINFKKDCRSNKIPSHLQDKFHSIKDTDREQLRNMAEISKAMGPIKTSKASQSSDPSQITKKLQEKENKYQVNSKTVYRPFDTPSVPSGRLTFDMPVIKVPELNQVPTSVKANKPKTKKEIIQQKVKTKTKKENKVVLNDTNNKVKLDSSHKVGLDSSHKVGLDSSHNIDSVTSSTNNLMIEKNTTIVERVTMSTQSLQLIFG